jgi:hypothetical protein
MAVDGRAPGHVFEHRESGDELMSNVACPCISLRLLPEMSLIAVICWAVVNCATLYGAPITFRFDAMVTTVSPGNPFDAGVQFALGDTISGEFTFDPAEGDGSKSFSAIQPYDFILHINGVSLATPSFEIEAINDVLIISDFPPSGVVDQLILGANGLSWAENTPILSFSPAHSGFAMSLDGAASILNQGSHPPGHIWNSFDLRRRLNVFLRDGLGGAVGFQATVGSFTVIPEPSAVAICFLIGMVVSIHFRPKRNIHGQRGKNVVR